MIISPSVFHSNVIIIITPNDSNHGNSIQIALTIIVWFVKKQSVVPSIMLMIKTRIKDSEEKVVVVDPLTATGLQSQALIRTYKDKHKHKHKHNKYEVPFLEYLLKNERCAFELISIPLSIQRGQRPMFYQ